MIRVLFPALLALAACGVAGEPEPPVKPGLTVSGTVSVGVVGGSGGDRIGAAIDDLDG